MPSSGAVDDPRGDADADREAVRALVHAYAELLDEGELDGVAHLFDHATYRTAGRAHPLTTFEEVRRVYDDVILYDGRPCTKHVLSNVTIVLDPDGRRASSRCYFTVMQSRPDLALQPVLCGRYHDAFEKVDGEWRFADRLILPDLVGDLSRHMRPGTGVHRP